MTDPVRFLNAFAHVLAVMTLYPEGHPSREGAVDAAFEGLSGLRLRKGTPRSRFSKRKSSSVANPCVS